MKTMKTSLILALVLAGSCVTATCNAQTAAAGAVAKVNGTTIPQSRLDFLVKTNLTQGQQDTPEIRTRIRDVLIVRELLSQEAVKKGLDKGPDVTIQLEMPRQEVLSNAFVQDYVKNNPISEDVISKEYDRAKLQAGDKEYKARHILVKSEDEAKQVIAQLKKGGNFEKLAAQKSEDPGSKGKGGDLDWSPSGRYVPQFGEVLKKLKKGQLTDAPVQTQFGWHVIRLEDERPMKFPPLEEVKGQIQQNLQRQAVEKAIADLRAKAKIE
jgi:peptidyl-prolyl cis-trans isomerase C